MLRNKIKKFFTIIKYPIYIHALLKGTAAAVEHQNILNNLNIEYIVDVGANRGQFALVARKCFPEATIHSIEPLEKPMKIFRSVFEKDDKVILHPYAIGSKNEVTNIHITEQDDSSSLLPIGCEQVNLFPDTREIGTSKVTVRTLDNLINISTIEKPALLKIDVQGYELETLKGCSKTLPHFSYIYVEASFIELYEGQALAHEVITYLANQNINLLGIYNTFYNNKGKAIQADFLFINSTCVS